jgi:hypothetical protein
MRIRSKIALGLIALIQVVLIILKACNVITLNWTVILMPAILFASLMMILGIFFAFIVMASIDED